MLSPNVIIVVGGEGQGDVGDDLLSRAVTRRVPSAQAGLTTGFEKGPGVPPPLEPPTTRWTAPGEGVREEEEE